MCQIGVGRAYNDVCILATPLGRIESLIVKLEYRNLHSGSNALGVNAAGGFESSQNGFQLHLYSTQGEFVLGTYHFAGTRGVENVLNIRGNI